MFIKNSLAGTGATMIIKVKAEQFTKSSFNVLSYIIEATLMKGAKNSHCARDFLLQYC